MQRIAPVPADPLVTFAPLGVTTRAGNVSRRGPDLARSPAREVAKEMFASGVSPAPACRWTVSLRALRKRSDTLRDEGLGAGPAGG